MSERSLAILSTAAICATFAGMLVFSWGTWPDVLVDFGHELYAPWALSNGSTLGVDLAWVSTGPLPPYVNALLFTAFGSSLRVLVVVNLTVLAAITALLFALTREVSDRGTATLATIAFLLVFAFGQYVGIGNYNYVTPYSHGVTHGLVLSLASIWIFRRHARVGGWWRIVAAGGGVGLVFLTKAEMFVACTAAIAALWAARALERRGSGEALRSLLALAVPAVAIPFVGFLLLLSQMPASSAWRVTVTPWLLMATPLTRTPFYLSGFGLDRPIENFAILIRTAMWWALVIGATALLDQLGRRLALRRDLTALVGVAAGALPLTLLLPLEAWFEIARPFPLFVAVGAIAYAWRILGRGTSDDVRSRAALGLALCAFAGGLLGKMLLNARIEHYGFALAMPAGMLVIVWIAWSAPRALARWRGGGTFFKAAGAGLVLAAAVAFVRLSHASLSTKTFDVGSGPDHFLADGRGAFVAVMLRQIERVTQPADTLAVVPEGVMINFLARRRNPTPYVWYMPDVIAAFGEERMLAAYRQDPPRFIVLVHRDATEHGAAFFGRDYARATMWWIRENYEPLTVVGAPPYQGDAYGMMLLRRRQNATSRAEDGRAP